MFMWNMCENCMQASWGNRNRRTQFRPEFQEKFSLAHTWTFFGLLQNAAAAPARIKDVRIRTMLGLGLKVITITLRVCFHGCGHGAPPCGQQWPHKIAGESVTSPANSCIRWCPPGGHGFGHSIESYFNPTLSPIKCMVRARGLGLGWALGSG